jgi:hypothetical protein
MRRLSIFVFFAFVLSACSPRLTVFSDSILQQANLNERDLSRTQFYVSEPIVLTRSANDNISKRVNGKIEVRDSRTVEKIVISKGTPGTFQHRTAEGNIAIGFEERCADCTLIFGPNPKRQGEYRLLALEWQRDYGIVLYNNLEYETPASSSQVRLMIDYRFKSQVRQRSKTASGRKIRS